MEMGTKKIPRIEPSKAYEVGLGRPTLIDDCHALPVSRITGYRLVDSQLIRCQVTPRHNRIPPRDPPGGEGGAQKAVGPIRFGDDKEPGCLLVEPMNHPGAFGPLALPGKGPASANQGINEGSGPVPGRRVDHHACRFVDYQQRLVLVDDLDRNVLTEDFTLFDARDLDPHDLAGESPVARALTAPINQHVTIGD
jgi:hypothetical protein